jgi:hypothetical protein
LLAWELALLVVVFRLRSLERSSAGHEVKDEDDDGEDEQDMYPSAQGVTADEAENPQDEENDCNGPKHGGLLRENRDCKY